MSHWGDPALGGDETGTREMDDLAARVIATARHTGTTLGTAESLTGGGVAHALTSVPGASEVVRGGIVSYATEVKSSVLGVDAALLAERGAVDAAVALAMAAGARRVLGCEVAVATTGVAGPDPADGKPVGLVFVAVDGPDGARVRELALSGSRAAIRSDTVAAALHFVLDTLAADPSVPLSDQNGIFPDNRERP